MKKRIAIEIICNLFVLLFVYTAVNKLIDYHSFTASLRKSPFLKPTAEVIAWLLPLTELLIASLFITPGKRKYALYASLALLLILTSYIAFMITFSPNLPCSCGGVISKLSWKQHVVFNLVFILLSFIGIKINEKENSTNLTSSSKNNTLAKVP